MEQKKIKVLQVIENDLSRGGVQDIMRALVAGLKDRVIFDIVVSIHNTHTFDSEFLGPGGKIYCIPRTKKFRSVKGLYHLLTDDRTVYGKALCLMQKNKYDAVYCANLFNAGPFLKAAKKSGVPVRIVHSMVAGSSTLPVYSRLINAVRRKTIHPYATQKLAITKASAEYLFGTSHGVHIVKSPIPSFESFLNLPYQKDPDGTIRLLQMGYMADRKNAKFTLDVFEQLLQLSPNYRLILAGHGEADYISQLKYKISQKNLTNTVTFMPYTVDPKERFQLCEALLLPSENEGLPLSLIEAQAAGIPCFVSDQVERDVNCGLCDFLPINDAKTWATAIHSYFMTKGTERGRASVCEWETKRICDQYYKWFTAYIGDTDE